MQHVPVDTRRLQSGGRNEDRAVQPVRSRAQACTPHLRSIRLPRDYDDTMNRIQAHDIGPIVDARVEFGDLTVLVGPQATGKSIFLQLLKLVVDKSMIHQQLQRFGIDWNDERDGFLEVYFGEGMAKLWTEGDSKLLVDDHEVEFVRYAGRHAARPVEKMSYIPAQRVLSFRDGITRPFTDYRSGDPYVLRTFSDRIHQLVQNEFSRSTGIFPHRGRLSPALTRPLERHVFGGFRLETEHAKYQRRIVLRRRSGTSLPFLVWSAGQREFVPLLMGLYPLLPPSAPPGVGTVRWVVAACTRPRVGASLLPGSWRTAGRRSGTPWFEVQRGYAGTRRIRTEAHTPGALFLPGRSRTRHFQPGPGRRQPRRGRLGRIDGRVRQGGRSGSPRSRSKSASRAFMSFESAVQAAPAAVAGAFRLGKQALPGQHRSLVTCADSRRLTGSVNLDAALQPSLPNSAPSPAVTDPRHRRRCQTAGDAGIATWPR